MSFITSPGVVGFTNNINNTAPNVTVPVSYFIGLGSPGNIDVAFGPKGSGSLLAQIPDNTATGGNKRGFRSVDLQMNRVAATNVCSGANSSLLGGASNTVAADTSVVSGGNSNNIAAGSDNSAIPGGAFCVIEGQNSMAAGVGSRDFGMFGSFVFGTRFTAAGDTQLVETTMGVLTTGAAAAILCTNNGTNVVAAQSFKNYALQDNSSVLVRALVTACISGGGEFAAFDILCGVYRNSGAASVVLMAAPTVTIVARSAGFAAITATIIADAALGGFTIQVVGIAATTIKWAAKVSMIVNKQ